MTKTTDTLLVEIGCEELPPKALGKLSKAFANAMTEELRSAGLLDKNAAAAEIFNSPRRLALRQAEVLSCQPDRTEDRLGPAVAAAFDDDGNPKPAATGFAKSCGVELAELERRETDKGVRLALQRTVAGQPLSELIQPMLERALGKLPIPKPMRWGSTEHNFVRPVQSIVALYGSDPLAGSLFDHAFGNTTFGHRFHHPEPVTINHPDEYPATLEAAHVIVDPAKRLAAVRAQVSAAIAAPDQVQMDPALLDEVANLVEWPVAMVGNFSTDFLAVPAEALVSSMQSHLRFFPVRNSEGELTARFVGVANIESQDPAQVVKGYERVITPRLADAQFFWETDLKTPLTEHQKTLDTMVYQKTLGSQWDKVTRVKALAEHLSGALGQDAGWVTAAAELAKTDLLTQMVGEFPDLQGTMGRYYAAAQGHPTEVSEAIESHYLPRFAGDALPPPGTGQVLALAERLDTLCGIFAAGLKPSGSRDPFALRRNALGLIRLLIEGELNLSLPQLIEQALTGVIPWVSDAAESATEVESFIMDRLRAYYADQGIKGDVFEAVWARRPDKPLDFHHRVMALQSFSSDPSAAALAAANKRIGNLLRKADKASLPPVDPKRFEDSAENALFDAFQAVAARAKQAASDGHYSEALTALATLRPSVDSYFDAVMVMADEPAIQDNRLASLAQVKGAFDEVADISMLQLAS